MPRSPDTCLGNDDVEQFVRGELDADSTRSIETHLGQCAACRQLLDDVSQNIDFEAQLKSRLGRAPPAPSAQPSSAHIGPYEIVRELGRGGMAVVYLARQSNPRRLVALKVLGVAQALDHHQVHLLRREGRVLALLRHPHLAAVYEAGNTEDGRPYLAMELVEGLPLLDYVARHSLSIRQRLELFLQVCDAVAHAHQRGVIHRDLKPSNILVETGGQAKVLDFGLARLRETDETAPSISAVSEIGVISGTIPYMSPEQIRGDRDAIDARSDIYSLGVVLDELLTGALPYTIDRTNLAAAARTICENPPARPGARVPALRGDVETIVLKALEKEPARRYATVPALADDLRRFLRGEPIAARPATLGYQLRKLVARHRVPFAIALAALVLLASASVALAVQAMRLERQRAAAVLARQHEAASRHEAEEQADIARSVNAFLADMLGAANPERSGEARDRKVVDVLDHAAASLATAFPDQPEVEAAVRFTLGDSYRALGQLAPAEEHLRRSLELRRQQLRGDHDDLAQSINKLARTLQDMGRYDEAEGLFREMLAMHQRLHGEHHNETAKAQNNLGWLLFLAGKLPEAHTLLEHSLATRRSLLGEGHMDLAAPLNNLGIVLMREGNHAEAEKMFRQSLAIDRTHRGEDHPNVVYTTISLAMLLTESERLDEAEKLLRASIDRLRRLLGDDHLNVAIAIHNLGVILRKQGDLAGAEARYLEAREMFLRVVGPDHPRVADTLDQLALVHTTRGEHAEAEPLHREALRIRQSAFPAGHSRTVESMLALSDTLRTLDRDSEAADLLSAALRAIDASLKPDEALREKILALQQADANRTGSER